MSCCTFGLRMIIKQCLIYDLWYKSTSIRFRAIVNRTEIIILFCTFSFMSYSVSYTSWCPITMLLLCDYLKSFNVSQVLANIYDCLSYSKMNISWNYNLSFKNFIFYGSFVYFSVRVVMITNSFFYRQKNKDMSFLLDWIYRGFSSVLHFLGEHCWG